MSKGATKHNLSRPVFFLSLAFIAVVAFAFINLAVVFIDTARDRSNLELTSELRALSYHVSGLARDATNGREEAFADLNTVLDQMDRAWLELKLNAGGIPKNTLGIYENAFTQVKQQADSIINEKETILFLNQVVDTLNQRLPQLQEEHTKIVETLLDVRAPADQVAVAQAQSWRAERIGRNVDKMLAGGDDAEAAADQFNRDANLFGRVLDGMKQGDTALSIGRITDARARASLDSISSQFEFVSNSIQEIFDATPALFSARQATDALLDETPTLLESGAAVSDAISALPATRILSNRSALAAGIVSVILLALIGFQVYASTRRSLKDTAEANEKNQQAILRLLDEIEGLGDGDLSAQATVTEDFTGAIADAINFAILQLRELVSRIQETAENVSAAANEARATALQLADASEHQSQEITGASQAITDMAKTIEKVSDDAAQSATVAQSAVSIATNGANVVQRNIKGMDSIREQIQDTSKRIKRLGESSQEIGDIVSLISDIADQTNILALNAAIQASMAGDAGRGFAVVADEVQRLAERSAGAAKQVATLVKAIQTDTNEAVSSMEQTTSEVVVGARLAHDAGSALEEIQSVSANLATLIQDISGVADHQARTADKITRTMNVIQDITSQTSEGTRNTAGSIGELAEMAIELREFVSDFKLPAGMMRADTGRPDKVPAAGQDFSAYKDILGEGLGDRDLDPDLEEDNYDFEPEFDADTQPDRLRAAETLDNDDLSFDEGDIAHAEAAVEPEVALSPAPAVLAVESRSADSKAKMPPTINELEAELASVDLDEFSIDEPKR